MVLTALQLKSKIHHFSFPLIGCMVQQSLAFLLHFNYSTRIRLAYDLKKHFKLLQYSALYQDQTFIIIIIISGFGIYGAAVVPRGRQHLATPHTRSP